MIKQINIERTEKEVVRVVVIYKNETKFYKKFEKLNSEELDFFRENAKNVWWFGRDGDIDTYIINTYTNYRICDL